jgi:hypothetical protein
MIYTCDHPAVVSSCLIFPDANKFTRKHRDPGLQPKSPAAVLAFFHLTGRMAEKWLKYTLIWLRHNITT